MIPEDERLKAKSHAITWINKKRLEGPGRTLGEPLEEPGRGSPSRCAEFAECDIGRHSQGGLAKVAAPSDQVGRVILTKILRQRCCHRVGQSRDQITEFEP